MSEIGSQIQEVNRQLYFLLILLRIIIMYYLHNTYSYILVEEKILFLSNIIHNLLLFIFLIGINKKDNSFIPFIRINTNKTVSQI